jgi:mannose-6-phosphate isomerase-like protein (cupin superfamily)
VKITREAEVEPFVTKDGSTVQELSHPARGGSQAQSLARAVVEPGGQTFEHFHRTSEEVYLFTAGEGRMRLGADEAAVRAGDVVVIPPGTPHKLWAGDGAPLELLCVSSPPYGDDDTVITEG